jgi:hypothetical protein
MKPIQAMFSRLMMVIFSVLSSVIAMAQEKTNVDINVNKDGGGNWYTQPWVWIVGGAVFILLLVALLRGNRSSD